MDTPRKSVILKKPAGEPSNYKQLILSTIDLTGGIMGGIAIVLSGQPLDTVKVKLQTFPNMYANPVHCFTQTYRDMGIFRGLYAGTVPNLMSNVMEKAVLFLAYGLCQKAVSDLSGKGSVHELSVFETAMAGSCASVFSGLALTPSDLIKCRLQALLELKRSGRLTGPLASVRNISASVLARHIVRTEGLRGMFTGLQATLLREMPGNFFFFGCYEGCKVLLTPPGKTKEDIGALRLLFCGGMGGVAFWVSIFPMDVIKSQIQVKGGSMDTGKNSYVNIVNRIVKEEGVQGLYKGFGITLVRTFICTSVMFLTYEKTKCALIEAAFGQDALG